MTIMEDLTHYPLTLYEAIGKLSQGYMVCSEDKVWFNMAGSQLYSLAEGDQSWSIADGTLPEVRYRIADEKILIPLPPLTVSPPPPTPKMQGHPECRCRTLPDGSDARKNLPLAEGVLFYFPAALAEVARRSKEGNDEHNPGQALHHDRSKSKDHEDCVLRHTMDARESAGDERTAHLAARAWRALAALQEHCESLGAPLAPNARVPE